MMDIQSLSGDWYEMAVAIRAIHFKCDPGICEDIKYGGLVFLRDKELLTGVFIYKKHISIEFGQGAKLPDPHSVLEGKGKFRRHIKIRSLTDISTKCVAQYVKQALAQ